MNRSQPPTYTPAQVYQPEQPAIIIHSRTSPLGNAPARTVCPSCHAEILTSVKHQANIKTHAFALVLFLLFCWPCVCVPYCMDSCQNANHYCPNCNAFIGEHVN